MANFPAIEPSFSVTKKSEPIVKVVTFADGFEHRLGFGLPNNQDPKIFDLKWENIKTVIRNSETFLKNILIELIGTLFREILQMRLGQENGII